MQAYRYKSQRFSETTSRFEPPSALHEVGSIA
jgi:hypothetical protein